MDEVLRELEVCRETMRAQAEEIKALRAMLETAMTLAHQANQRLEAGSSAALTKRGRGRPKKVADEAWLVDAFNDMRAAFIKAKPRTKPTDQAVLNWWFKREFVIHGMGLRGFDFWSDRKLKVLKNRLGVARASADIPPGK
jgi:hypothetical protein